MRFTPLQTERLIIRNYEADDLEARHDLARHAFESPTTPAETQTWLDWTLRNYQALAELNQPPYGDYAVVLQPTHKVIGSVGLVPSVIPWGVLGIEKNAHRLVSPEFGLFWAILPRYQGQGFATEAVQALINWLFQTMQIRRIVATTEFENLSSQRVMEKLGMTLYKRQGNEPFWFEVVGVLNHPELPKE